MKSELKLEGIDFDALRDPWGRPYAAEFGVRQTNYLVWVRSSGPDKKFTSPDSDDVLLWTSSIDYSADLQAKIDAALTAHFKATNQIPQTETEYKGAIARGGLTQDELNDPWGRPYYVTFKQSAIYGNRVTIFTQATYGQKAQEKTELTPVTQQLSYIYLRATVLTARKERQTISMWQVFQGWWRNKPVRIRIHSQQARRCSCPDRPARSPAP